MHKESMLEMMRLIEHYYSRQFDDDLVVLDVGSLDVNGSYKQLMPSSDRWNYVGVDLVEGNGNNITQLNRINDSMSSRIDNAGIMIGSSPGNHDGDTSAEWNNYFGYSFHSTKDYFGGTYNSSNGHNYYYPNTQPKAPIKKVRRLYHRPMPWPYKK